MKNYEIKVIPRIAEDGSVYWSAMFPAVANCVGSGDTPEEATKEAYANLQVYLAYLEDEGYSIPEEYEENEYSGKLTLRIPKSIHKMVVETAEKEGVSVNTYINTCLSVNLGKDQYKNDLKQNIEEIKSISVANTKIGYNTNQLVGGIAQVLRVNTEEMWREQ